MATRGFEFAYMLDGGSGTPLIRDWEMATDAGGLEQGDLMGIDSSGRAVQITTGVGEVLGVIAERDATTVADDELLKIAIITRNQVWRCSMDAASHSGYKGYTKRFDTVDQNTVDATDLTTGSLILVHDGDELDDDGNVIGYFVFADTTFGNT